MSRPLALVTGASSGIGKALALLLARKGHAVALVARRRELLLNVAREIRAAGGEAHVCPVDLTSPGAFEETLGELLSRTGRLDMVVAAAGMGAATPGWALDEETARKIIDINVSAFVATVAAVLPPMLEKGSGHLVALSSLAAYRGLPGNGVYCASKAFVRTFMESLRGDLRGKGITLTTVSPGWVKTPMTEANRIPMPFILDVDKTAEMIWKAVHAGKSRLDLPLALGLFSRAGAFAPDPVFDLFMRGKTWPFGVAQDRPFGVAQDRPFGVEERPSRLEPGAKAAGGKPLALVTGASTGIGKAVSIRLAREGYDLAMMARRRDVLEEAAVQVRAAGATVHTFALDITDESRLREAVEEILRQNACPEQGRRGGIDLLVANAGTGAPTPGTRLKLEVVRRIIDLNVSAFVHSVALVLPSMLERRSGHIVGISSLAAYRGLPKSAAYCASKSFVSTFLESMRADLRGLGISVTAVHPGFVKTPLTDKNKTPMPFLMRSEDAAERIWRAIEKKKARVAFPFPLSTAMGAARLLPDALVGLVLR